MLNQKSKLPFGWTAVPLEPSRDQLMSMAMRYDHGLGCPGYYDNEILNGAGLTHEMRVSTTLGTMRQLYEEAIGEGFYKIQENQPVNLPEELTVHFKEEEMKALSELCDKQDMTSTAILRQALRLYQMVQHKIEKDLQLGFFDKNGNRELSLPKMAESLIFYDEFSQPIKFDSTAEPDVTKWLEENNFSLDAKTSWWEIVNFSVEQKRYDLAQKAQKYAVPVLNQSKD